MATTKTYLCYGIPVTNESLTYATLAYQRLEGPFRFTRLVQKRRREGTLQTSPTSAVGSLPVELWDLVRYKLTDLELSATKRKFMIDHACGDCSEEASEEDPRISYWNNLSACSWCEEEMNEYKGFEDHSMARLRPTCAKFPKLPPADSIGSVPCSCVAASSTITVSTCLRSKSFSRSGGLASIAGEPTLCRGLHRLVAVALLAARAHQRQRSRKFH
jgi:hypothetical protein